MLNSLVTYFFVLCLVVFQLTLFFKLGNKTCYSFLLNNCFFLSDMACLILSILWLVFSYHPERSLLNDVTSAAAHYSC